LDLTPDNNSYIFFFGHSLNKILSQTHGFNEAIICFSNWFTCSFEFKTGPTNFPQYFYFTSTEQWMMFMKAILFRDFSIAQTILNASDPFNVKKLGRAIKLFDESVWSVHKKNIMIAGLVLKFSQNDYLKKILLLSGNSTLVEASPFDGIWGIKMNATQAMKLKAKDARDWTMRSTSDKNNLGKSLCETRTIVRSL
jgi:hypothetical protein